MSAPRPTAAGTLAKTPFENLLVYLLERRMTGTLVLEAPGGKKSAVFFAGGVPAKAQTAEPVIHLGRLLLEMGYADEAAINETLTRLAKEKRLHGQLLLEARAISEEQLRDGLREQISRKVGWLFTLPAETAYGYYDSVNFLSRWGGEPTPVRPLATILRGIRRSPNKDRMAAMLLRLPNGPLRFHPDAAVNRFQLSKDEQAIVDVMRARPQPLAGLKNTGLIAGASLDRLMYCFALTRHLDLGEGSGDPIWGSEAPSSRRPRTQETGDTRRRTTGRHPAAGRPDTSPDSRKTAPMAADVRAMMTASLEEEGISIIPPGKSQAKGSPEPPPASEPPPPSTEQTRSFRTEINERFEVIDTISYYDMLGVPENAPTGIIQQSFFQLAKKWHPDKLPRQLESERAKVTKVFARLSEAHQMLADPEQRSEYDRLMKEGGASAEEQEQVQKVLRAASCFQKAEVLFKKRDMVAAEEQARKAVEDDPSQSEYQALYAWIQAQRADRMESGKYDDLIVILDQSVAAMPENIRILWYRGQLLKRAARMNKALKDFKKILELRPSHVDAQREIRLWEMRRKSGPQRGRSEPDSSKKKSSSSKSRGASKAPASEKDGLLNQDLGQLWGKLFKK